MNKNNKENPIKKYMIKAWDEYYLNNKIIPKVKQELLDRPDLVEKLKENKDCFIKWAAKQRLVYEADIDDEVNDFVTGNFGDDHIRMYQYNVKKWYDIIKKVFERDKYTYQYCGSIGGKLEADHIIPFSKGGSDDTDNLITSCRKCNRQKKDKSLDEFINWKTRNNG